jgi:hypothetical protein
LNTEKLFQGGRNQNLRRRSDKNHLISCGDDLGPLDMHPVNEGSIEERNRPNFLDLSSENQQQLDPEISAQDLTLVCTGEWTRKSPKVS